MITLSEKKKKAKQEPIQSSCSILNSLLLLLRLLKTCRLLVLSAEWNCNLIIGVKLLCLIADAAAVCTEV
ncbi:hypothetical protein LWI29_033061 [Acer saccharum]|uniref:Uncharacterized protein n=1 Tax=Acer saccharum TaxID=4024 RepID=A0AA39TM04_ACESA|nr:hypothetical protein LWI29_033061 [Acer saccharum]KAK1588518.1 hypothetical protein Q3G72_024295 [Acer saccharum]